MTFDALTNADPGIVKLSRDYFDLMHHQNMETFDRVFHPDSVLYGVSDNKLNIVITGPASALSICGVILFPG